MSVNISGSGAVGLGVGVGSYHPGVYVPLKALFLVTNALKLEHLMVKKRRISCGRRTVFCTLLHNSRAK